MTAEGELEAHWRPPKPITQKYSSLAVFLSFLLSPVCCFLKPYLLLSFQPLLLIVYTILY